MVVSDFFLKKIQLTDFKFNCSFKINKMWQGEMDQWAVYLLSNCQELRLYPWWTWKTEKFNIYMNFNTMGMRSKTKQIPNPV